MQQAQSIPFSVTAGEPVIGQPWEHGDSFPHRGRLANDEACSTSPGGQHEKRQDPRDVRVERVFPDARFSSTHHPRGARRVNDDVLGTVYVQVLNARTSVQGATLTSSAEARERNARRLTKRWGRWFDRVVYNQ